MNFTPARPGLRAGAVMDAISKAGRRGPRRNAPGRERAPGPRPEPGLRNSRIAEDAAGKHFEQPRVQRGRNLYDQYQSRCRQGETMPASAKSTRHPRRPGTLPRSLPPTGRCAVGDVPRGRAQSYHSYQLLYKTPFKQRETTHGSQPLSATV